MISVKSRGVLLAGVLLGFASFSLPAAEASALMQNLSAQRLEAYQLQTMYYLLSLEEGAARGTKELQVAAQTFSGHVEQLGELTAGQGLEAQVQTLQQQARRFQQLVEAGEEISASEADPYARTDFAASSADLNQGYSEFLDALVSKGLKSDPLQEQAILMQRIATVYVYGATSLDGGGVENSEALGTPIDTLAKQFRQQLLALDQQYAGQMQVSERLRQVTTRWNFIEASLLKSNVKQVPFIIVLSSDKIVASLSTAEADKP